MTFQTTAFYAAIFTILIVILANIVSAKRGKTGISILHGSDLELALWTRRHGNMIENIPLALLLMAFCEARGLSGSLLHIMGLVLLIARLLHIFGLHQENVKSPLRIAGGIGTQLSMLSAAGYLLWSLY